jgi:hypothetical protein
MMNYEDLVKSIVGGFEDDFRVLFQLKVMEVRNLTASAMGSITIDPRDMSINVYSSDIVKLKVDNTKRRISVFSINGERNNIFDTIMALRTFVIIMTTLKLKGFCVSKKTASITLRSPKAINDSVDVLFNALLREAELDEDTTK